MEASFLKLHCPFAPYEEKRGVFCEADKDVLSLETFEYFTLGQTKLVVSW